MLYNCPGMPADRYAALQYCWRQILKKSLETLHHFSTPIHLFSPSLGIVGCESLATEWIHPELCFTRSLESHRCAQTVIILCYCWWKCINLQSQNTVVVAVHDCIHIIKGPAMCMWSIPIVMLVSEMTSAIVIALFKVLGIGGSLTAQWDFLPPSAGEIKGLHDGRHSTQIYLFSLDEVMG